jgi:PAS domain S-box-containing protein
MDYSQLVDLSPDGIFVTRNNSIVFVNPAALRMFGATTPDQVVGQSPLRFFHPARHTQIRERVRQLMMGKAVPAVEETLVRVDGGTRDVEVTGTLFEDAPDRVISVIMRDITERKQTESALRESEERLSLAFAGAQEGVWDWNLETGAVVYSPHWKKMLGYTDDEIEPHVSAWERLLHPDDREVVREVVRWWTACCAASAITRWSSGSVTRTATSFMCSRVAFLSAVSPTASSPASSARIST